MNKKVLFDNYHRKIDYLRISVTDRCNLRCIYCLPEEGIKTLPKKEILSFEEIERIVKLFLSLGVNKIKITGGEPLVRKNIEKLIYLIAHLPISDLSLTTNGTFLEKLSSPLYKAGLRRINISLDSLNKDKFYYLTRGGDLNLVLRGIDSALSLGFNPVKINTVVLRDLNFGEIKDFAHLTFKLPLHIRFIELMPLGDIKLKNKDSNFVSVEEIKYECEKLGKLYPTEIRGSGPAEYYRYKDSIGSLGFISPISTPFCYRCNKLRLTADGELKFCLHHQVGIALKPIIRKNIRDEELKKIIIKAVRQKPLKHNLPTKYISSNFMAQIGG